MALQISIEDLLNKRKVERYKIEFKKGWTPADIYHSICALHDFDNLWGCYVLVDAEENEYGIVKRPILGINIKTVDGFLKQMIGFNNMFAPFYLPRPSVEEEYANYGFDYIQEKLEDNPNFFFKETAFLRVFLGFLYKEEDTEDFDDAPESLD